LERRLARRTTPIAAVLFAAALALIVAAAFPHRPAAQQAQVPGAFRVRVTLVPVDVRVTDANGRPVLDLTKDDFVILENGVRQEVSHFSQEVLTPMEPPAGEKVMLRNVPTFELSSQTARTFLIVLGRGRLQGPTKGIDGLIRFVRKDLLPQDRVAVLAYNRATDFTTDHERIAQVIERFRKYHEGIEAKLALRFSGLAAVYGSKEIPKSLQPDIEKIFRDPGAQANLGSRQVPPGSVTDSGRLAADAREVTDAFQRLEAAELTGSGSVFDAVTVGAVTGLSFEEYVSTNASTAQDLQNIYTGIEYMRYIEGEKRLLFFTEQGLFLPRLENDKSVAALANDARVAIDTFQTGGIITDGGTTVPGTLSPSGVAGASARSPAGAGIGGAPPGTAPSQTSMTTRAFALGTLKNVSDLTGGQASVLADAYTNLARLNESTRAHYLLGYYPADTRWDGKYRQITVRVNRPGVRVSYRHGFYARETLQPFDREAFMAYSRITAAGQYNGEVKDLAFRVRTSEASGADGAREIQVDLSIDVSRVRFQVADGRYQGKLHVTTFYGDNRGRYVGGIWQEIELNLREETYKGAQKSGLPYSVRVPRTTPGQTLKVIVYDYNADLVGSAMVTAK
jgi:VWFA-related protein